MKPRLNLLDVCMLVIGAMVGSGVFIVAAGMARDLGSPIDFMLAWGINGVIILCGALTYGELSAAMPQSGGQYVYLREIYGPLAAFLYGWTLFMVIQSGFLAAVSIAFASYTGVLFPAISPENSLFSLGKFSFTAQQLTAIVCLTILTAYNLRGVKEGALLSNILTFIKISSLVLIITLTVWLGIKGQGSWEHFSGESKAFSSWAGFIILGAAMVGPLFSSDAWNFIAFIAGEVKNPQRNIALGMLISVSVVVLGYFFVNGAYIYALSFDEIAHAKDNRVAAVFMTKALGESGGILMAILTMISTFGCLNSCIIMGARCFYAMANDGLFFPQGAKLNDKGVPAFAMIAQFGLGAALTLTGKYNDLLDYIMLAVLIFYALTVAGVIVLRYQKPDLTRPYKTLGYPLTPVLYIVAALWVVVSLLIQKPEYTWPCAIIVALGIPVYFIFKKTFKKTTV